MNSLMAWTPAIILGIAAVTTVGIDPQRTMPLRAALPEVMPQNIETFAGQDLQLSEAEMRVAGVDDYVLRVYTPPNAGDDHSADFSVYVGYYARQTQGHTIHSPKNCLPGAGWQALTATTVALSTAAGPVQVNRYLLQREDQKALVLYWYQGRGRIQANEYRVKLDLLRDATLRRRSDEALVRIVVPVGKDGEAPALARAQRIARQVLPAVNQALPL